MSKCIICNKDILGTEKVTLDNNHDAHLVCFYSSIPQVDNKESSDSRTKKIDKIVKDIIIKYDKKNY